MLTDIVRARLQRAVDAETTDLIKQFDTRITKGDHLAVDQLLNASRS
ncbi:hypothetical protein HRW16_28790 [Streptomyces lunaelactis]|nr:hypothetical protein [Streptomyces lunaelactis]NUK28450.1 hypothetical protein [Streptomyces lunaelactis]NUK39649.1 hypothetical protein [Streptomyces lunaelactis]NUK61289.1 hypothetical protein [Streptomyces lunaelactis]NUK95751.1 hypothetical protein [Streptomyces lunaelactis]NUL29737.1 hypothetical protein [Streptomyces lunaelactis]